jgi:hypothetical protein
MARPVAKHQDDDGDLSIFASGDFILIACEHGHFWSIDAKERSTEAKKLDFEGDLTPDRVEAMFKAF